MNNKNVQLLREKNNKIINIKVWERKAYNEMKKIWEIYKQYFAQEKQELIKILVLTIVGLVITSITPYLYGQIIDSQVLV